MLLLLYRFPILFLTLAFYAITTRFLYPIFALTCNEGAPCGPSMPRSTVASASYTWHSTHGTLSMHGTHSIALMPTVHTLQNVPVQSACCALGLGPTGFVFALHLNRASTDTVAS